MHEHLFATYIGTGFPSRNENIYTNINKLTLKVLSKKGVYIEMYALKATHILKWYMIKTKN